MPDRPLTNLTCTLRLAPLARPFATRQLADLGARVVQVEPRGLGDFTGHDVDLCLVLENSDKPFRERIGSRPGAASDRLGHVIAAPTTPELPTG